MERPCIRIPMTDTNRLTAALAGRYRIERELGAGGMATVYLAQDLRHDRKVAVKVMKSEVSAGLAADRFLREIRTTANLQHPNIVPVFDSGSVPGPDGSVLSLYFVMPLIEGETLRERLQRDTRLPVEEAIRLVRELADALQYAHEAGILHRDLKPENVMLSRGHALLADFGIAHTAASDADNRLTGTGLSIGTPAYMSPEQATGERELTPASDVYGLGAILFELLTGAPPFTGPTPQAILVKRFTNQAPPLRSLRSDAPPSCELAVARALATDPEQRFATAAAFAAAILAGAAAPDSTSAADDRSLLVLPCVNAGGGAEDEQFADGLTEEIITDLSRVKALRVLSRTSSMQLKGTTKSIPQLGRELKVRYALSGSVRRAGNSLRITAELVDVTRDTPLWAERFSGTMDDIFDVQERVAREIVKALDVTLTADEDRRLADRPIGNVRAFELYLQARQAMQRYDLKRGHALLDQAIAIEGEVPALRALRAYGWYALVRMGEDRTTLDRVDAEARMLVGTAPDAPYGYALGGFVAYERGDLASAVRLLRLAEARDPTDANLLFELGISLQAASRHAESEEVSARLTARDPLSPFAELLAGANTWFVGRAAEGLAFIQRALALEPGSVISHWGLGYNYALAGRLDAARAEADWMQARAPQLPYTAQIRGLVTACEGDREGALAIIRPVDWEALDAHHTFHLSESFAMAGDTDTAHRLFERAVDNGFYPVDYFTTHCPFLAPLRGTAEFDRIVAKARRRVADFSA